MSTQLQRQAVFIFTHSPLEYSSQLVHINSQLALAKCRQDLLSVLFTGAPFCTDVEVDIIGGALPFNFIVLLLSLILLEDRQWQLKHSDCCTHLCVCLWCMTGVD